MMTGIWLTALLDAMMRDSHHALTNDLTIWDDLKRFRSVREQSHEFIEFFQLGGVSFIGIHCIFVLPPFRLSNMPEDYWTFRISCCTNTYLFSRVPNLRSTYPTRPCICIASLTNYLLLMTIHTP